MVTPLLPSPIIEVTVPVDPSAGAMPLVRGLLPAAPSQGVPVEDVDGGDTAMGVTVSTSPQPVGAISSVCGGRRRRVLHDVPGATHVVVSRQRVGRRRKAYADSLAERGATFWDGMQVAGSDRK